MALLVICVLGGLLIARTHLLVNIANDRNGQPLLDVAVLHPGDSAAGDVVLSNQGLAPIEYTLSVNGPNGSPPPAQAVVTIERIGGSVLYRGPLPRQAVKLGTLRPGEKAPLHVGVTVPAGAGPPSLVVALAVNFTWAAYPAVVPDAWWMYVAALVVLLVVAGSLWFVRGRS